MLVDPIEHGLLTNDDLFHTKLTIWASKTCFPLVTDSTCWFCIQLVSDSNESCFYSQYLQNAPTHDPIASKLVAAEICSAFEQILVVMLAKSLGARSRGICFLSNITSLANTGFLQNERVEPVKLEKHYILN